MSYQPGTHIVASLSVVNTSLITTFAPFRERLNELISEYSLVKLGEVYHDFKPAGFTGVVCLSESHISIHTWPEHNLVNLDIYLSNFERDNDGTVSGIYSALTSWFNGAIIHEQSISR